MVCPGLIENEFNPFKALTAKADSLNRKHTQHLSPRKSNCHPKLFKIDEAATHNDVKIVKMSKVKKLNIRYKPYDRGKDK